MPYIGIDFGTSNSVVANFQYGQAEVVPNQEILTADGVQVKVSALITYRVADAGAALLGVESFQQATYANVQTALRECAARRAADDLLAQRAELDAELRAEVQPAGTRIGLEVASVRVRDLMLPAEWKRANLLLVKARQEGIAALERARGETAALRSLANAARTIDGNPNLLQLRLLQAVAQFGEGSGGNTLVLGVPGVLAPGVAAARAERGDGAD